MRLGIFGGSFDPPHLGHTMACLWALESGEVDRVLLVPVARHAFGKEAEAPFEQRVAMARLAVERLGEGAEVSDIEGRRPGINYMVDTLRELSVARPATEFRLIVGSDVAEEVSKWRMADAVVAMAPLLELPRPRTGERFDERPGALPPISSTAVRQALRSGTDVSLFLSARVRDYIRQHGLYRADAPEPS